jgi:uroporphyrinogen-III synthase
MSGVVVATALPGHDAGWLTWRAVQRLKTADVVVLDASLERAVLPDDAAVRRVVEPGRPAVAVVLEEAARGQVILRLVDPARWDVMVAEERPAWTAAGCAVVVLPVPSEAAVTAARALAHGPLAGRRVLTLRPAGQEAMLETLLEEAGAEPLTAPVVAVRAPDWGAADPYLLRLDRYQWLVFTSTNGVEAFFDRLRFLGGDIRRLPPHLAAVGGATARALSDLCLRVDIVPSGRQDQEGLLAALVETGVRGQAMLLAVGNRRRPVLADGLRAHGAVVDEAVVYATEPAPLPPWVDAALEAGQVDAVLFTAGSTAEFLVSQLSPAGRAGLHKTVRVSIGPATSQVMEALGIPPTRQADEPTMVALVAALEKVLG